MDINYSKKNIGNINTVAANNTRIKFSNSKGSKRNKYGKNNNYKSVK